MVPTAVSGEVEVGACDRGIWGPRKSLVSAI